MASDTDEDDVMEFELPVSVGPSADLFAPHRDLFDNLGLDRNDTAMSRIFDMMAALCDPMTQPGENGVFQLSVRGIADVATTLAYQIVEEEKYTESTAKESFSEAKLPPMKAERALADSPEMATANHNDSGAVDAENGMVSENRENGMLVLPFNIQALLRRFETSLHVFHVLCALNSALRTDSEVETRHLQLEPKNYAQSEQFWLPLREIGADDHTLKVVYYMCCVAAQMLLQMFRNETEQEGEEEIPDLDDAVAFPPVLLKQHGHGNLARNPYTDYLLRMWKCHTRVVELALDMDRELERAAWEQDGDGDDVQAADLPDDVRRALVGSAAVRVVLAAGLQHDYLWKDDDTLPNAETVDHDLTTMSMLDFFDPGVRILGGALISTMEPVAAAMLILRAYTDFLPAQYDLDFKEEHAYAASEGPETAYWQGLASFFPDAAAYDRDVHVRRTAAGMSVDLSSHIVYDDRLDFDVRYVFEYEDDSVSERSDEFPMALRRDVDDIEFDEQGRDWRDRVRGDNDKITPEFAKLLADFDPADASDHFFSTFRQAEEGLRVFALLEIEYMPRFLEHVGQALVNTVALAATQALDGDATLVDALHRFLVAPAPPELLHEALTHRPSLLQTRRITTFELVLAFNPATATAVMDELLMVNGLRRSAIWFMCHSVNLHMLLVNYVYELASGLRGNAPGRVSPYKFLREGALVLSAVEKLMLLHEFLLNAGPWLLSDAGDTLADVPTHRAEKMVACLCVMVQRLVSQGVIEFARGQDEFDDYSHDVQGLLFPWIGRVPEARALYFDMKAQKFGVVHHETDLLKDKPESVANMPRLVGPTTNELGTTPNLSGNESNDALDLQMTITGMEVLDTPEKVEACMKKFNIDKEELEEKPEPHDIPDLELGSPDFPLASDKFQRHYERQKIRFMQAARSLREDMASDMDTTDKFPAYKLAMVKQMLSESQLFALNTTLAVALTNAYGNPLKPDLVYEGYGPYFEFNHFISTWPYMLFGDLLRAVEWQIVEVDPNGKALDAHENGESEFNDRFLEGKVQYLEKEKKKKKKTKKKKKR